jgi:hypothetical protein
MSCKDVQKAFPNPEIQRTDPSFLRIEYMTGGSSAGF